MYLYLPLTLLLLIALPTHLHYFVMKVEPSTCLNPDRIIIESDYSYIKRSRQREGATVMDTTHLIYKSGALSHRNSTSAGLDKSIEVPPINTQGRPS